MHLPRIFSACQRTVLALVLGLSASTSYAQEVLFTDGFEPARAQTDAQAARFLNRATFGATAADIALLRAGNYSAWIDQQISRPITLQRVALQALAGTFVSTQAAQVSIRQDDRIRHWYRSAVVESDQLRQRLAWAISQIIVISDQGDALSGEPLMLAEWNDIIMRNAFGNYRDLLQQATRSPTMGRWLTSLRNRKFEGTLSPDENYAREIMQLFSIGLIERNLDFSPVLIGGNTIPTYDNATITAIARAFTGLSYDCTGNALVAGTDTSILRNCGGTTCTGTDCRFESPTFSQRYFNDPTRDDSAANVSGTTNIFRGLRHEDYFRPMVCYPRYNDTGRQSNGTPWDPALGLGQPTPAKRIVIGGAELLNIAEIATVPGQPSPPNCNSTATNVSTIPATTRTACLQYCESNVDNIVDLLFNHPNTGAVIAQQLIQRFVTSNPTPAYIRRVACTFGGTTAPLAQCPIRTSNLRGDMAATVRAVLLDSEALASTAPVNFGKTREPLLKMMAIWRSMGAVMPEISNRTWGPTNPQDTFVQRPFGAPTVFNFYEPSYQQPGAIAAAGLLSPEIKIINEVSIVLTGNELLSRICNGYNNCNSAFSATPPTSPYIPPASLDALPLTDDIALIEAFNTRMMAGSMSGTMNLSGTCAAGLGAGGVGTGMKGILYRLVRCAIPGQTAAFGATVDDRRRKALYLLHIIAISPEYNTQR